MINKKLKENLIKFRSKIPPKIKVRRFFYSSHLKLLIKKLKEINKIIMITKNNKKILKNTFYSIFIFCIILGQLISPSVAHAATYDFVQSGWSSGATVNTANHFTDQTGWVEFQSKNNVETSSTISLSSYSFSTSKTSLVDFSSGGNSQTAISGSGDDASIQISKTNFVSPKMAATFSSGPAYALKSDGTVWGWGLNTGGQLGVGDGGNRSNPVQVHGFNNIGYLTNIIDVSANYYSTYALKSDGTVWSWGGNADGRLGTGLSSTNTPVQIPNLTNIIAISSGNSSAYALKSDGTVWSWGSNSNGQLGIDSITESNVPVQVLDSDSVGYLENVISISGGENSAYALKSDGTVWAWGYNNNGQLGDNTTEERHIPVQVHGINNVDYLSNVVFIRGGHLTANAILSDGSIVAWGNNSYNRLGDGTSTNRSTPVKVVGSGGSGFFSNAVSVFSGVSGIDYFSIALKSDGTVWAWGRNNAGQLGDGTATNRSTPIQVHGLEDSGLLGDVVSISTGGGSSYALKSNGDVLAWGDNWSYKLGDGTTTQRKFPVNTKDVSTANFNIGIDSYYSSGNYTSSVIDLERESFFSNISYDTTLNGQNITVDVRAGNTLTPDGTWTNWLTNISSGGDISSLGSKRYLQYKVNLSTSDISITPTFNSITINYNQYASNGDLTSSVYNSEDSANLLNKLSWTSSNIGTGEEIKFQIRSSSDGVNWSSWCGYSDCSSNTYFSSSDNGVALLTNHPLRNGSNDKYFQYKVYLTSDGGISPVLSSVSLRYVVNAKPSFNTDFPTTGAGGVTASQNLTPSSDNFGKVEISYSAKDVDTNTGTTNPNKILPSFEYSIDGGSNWVAIPTENLSDGSTSLLSIYSDSYTTYNTVWDVQTTISEVSVSSAKIRVTINDNEAANNIATASSSNFKIDTKDPIVSTPVTFDAGVAGLENSAIVTIPKPTDESTVYYLVKDNDASETNPQNTGWVEITDNTTIPWTFDSDIEIKYLKYQFKDEYGNIGQEYTISTQTPVPSSSFLVQDTSNVSTNPPYYDMYVGWQPAGSDGFYGYKLEYSTSLNNVNYGEYFSVPNPNLLNDVSTNYYIFRNLDPDYFYRYRLGVIGANGNISVRSNAYTTAKPDGIQNYGEGGGGSAITAPKIENVSVSQDSLDKTISVSYKLTDASVGKKPNVSYEGYLFYNIGIFVGDGGLDGSSLSVSDGSKLKSSGYILVNNEIIKYTGKNGNILTGVTRGTWPNLNSSGRATRVSPFIFPRTIVWVLANGTSPISITDDSILTGQNGSIAWDTYNETSLAGDSYSNVGIKVVVHDNQDALSGPISNQNDYSEDGVLRELDLVAPIVSFDSLSSFGDENSASLEIPISLNRAYPIDSIISYTLSGTATSGLDYNLVSNTVNISQGQTSASIPISIINDDLKESDETIIITLSNPLNATLGDDIVYTYTINDDDASSEIEFSGIINLSGTENVSSVLVPISLSDVSGMDVSVDYVLSGTATSLDDYTLTNGTINIIAGETTTNISIPIVNDILKEESETIIITLSNPNGATLGQNTIYTYIIIDDDIYPTLGFTSVTSQSKEDVNTVNIPVSISSQYAEDITFSYSVTGGSAEGNSIDYLLEDNTGTIFAGQTTTNIPIIIFDDDLSEDTETIILTLSNPTNAVIGSNSIHAYSLLDNEILVTEVNGSSVKSTSARITWTTADYTDSLIEYGTIPPGEEGSYAFSKLSLDKVLNHDVYLANLTPSTKYYFKTTSVNLAERVTVSTSDFTTTPGPVISNVSSGNQTDTGITINWTTDIPSTSYVNYSTNQDLSSSVRFGSAELVTEHSVTLSGLNTDSIYYYLVDSTDESGNIGEDANGGSYYNFSTSEDETAPVISGVSAPIITASSVAIVWTTNELASGKVSYSTTSGDYDDESDLLYTPVINHLITINNLEESTTYYYTVESSDENGNTTVSDEYSFSTTEVERVTIRTGGGAMIGVAQELYDILLAENQTYKARLSGMDSNTPVVSNIEVSDITAFGATVSFETSEDTVSFIEYGKDTTFGLMAADKNWTRNHRIRLYGLSLGTEYSFKINAMDKSNDTGVSDNQTFTTRFLSEDMAELKKIENVEQFQEEIEATIESILPSLVPPFIDKPIVSDITESSVVINFRTNIKSYPIISYISEDKYNESKDNKYDSEVSDTSKKSVSHTISLVGLKSNTKYHFKAKAFSLPQVVGESEDYIFTTSASKIQASVIGVKKDSFTVVWSTDEPTSSIVEYKNLKTGIVSKIVDNVKNSSHSLKIENLSPGTPYEINVSGINDKGNLVESTSSINTKTSTDNNPPVITNLKVDSALVVGRTDRVQTIISWQTDEPSTSVVYYEEGSGSLEKELANKQEDLELTKNHVVILTTLRPGMVYRFTVSSTDDANNTIKPPIRTIITPKKSESIVDVIFKNFDDTFNFVNNVR